MSLLLVEELFYQKKTNNIRLINLKNADTKGAWKECKQSVVLVRVSKRAV